MATDPATSEARRGWWRYARTLLVPVLVWGLLVGALVALGPGWVASEERYDEGAVREWVEEARNADLTLADLVVEYQRRAKHLRSIDADNLLAREPAMARVFVKREEIYQALRALGEPATKMYPGQLPLFPVVYRLEVQVSGLDPDPADPLLDDMIVWDSGQEPSSGQYRRTAFDLRGKGVVRVNYQLRAWNKRQRDEESRAARMRLLSLLAVAGTALGLAWFAMMQADERENDRRRRADRERLDVAERLRLREESLRVSTERELLEQRLATQAAERQALELRSHLYASIGIMAGSYAHNIKNLLVRPNDLLRRCLERTDTPPEQARMLREVEQTLGTVTERLQQILRTVRRDPSLSRTHALDLNALVESVGKTWADLAAERWAMDVVVERSPGPLPVAGDESHLVQAVENLLFNARDATFESRNQRRELARKVADPQAKKAAVLAAASHRGRVMIRTRRGDGEAILEVTDNGVGMSPEVVARCTETHFTTKRDNALYEGHSTGMGLGLSFVTTILENHKARLEIESTPSVGTTFRVRFPDAPPAG